jgi:hypothetical protein
MREAQTRNDGEAVLLEMGLRQVKYNAWSADLSRIFQHVIVGLE